MTSFDRLHIDLSVPEGNEDYADEQLVIGDERAWLELQEPELIKEVGGRALIAAQRLLNLAYVAREVLQDWEEVPATRRKRVDLIASVPDLLPDVES